MIDETNGPTIIGEPSERTITAAELASPFIYDQYNRIRTQGAEGRSVLVVGSGPNTDRWRTLGCETLDIDQKANPDIVADANKLDSVVGPETQQIIIGECVALDPSGKIGVDLKKFIPQAFAALTDGGQLFFVTAAQISEPPRPRQTLLAPIDFKRLLKDCGFKNVASWSGPIYLTQSPKIIGDKAVQDEFAVQSAVIYHGQKIK